MKVKGKHTIVEVSDSILGAHVLERALKSSDGNWRERIWLTWLCQWRGLSLLCHFASSFLPVAMAVFLSSFLFLNQYLTIKQLNNVVYEKN